jgi:hypothetical protein
MKAAVNLSYGVENLPVSRGLSPVVLLSRNPSSAQGLEVVEGGRGGPSGGRGGRGSEWPEMQKRHQGKDDSKHGQTPENLRGP